MAKCKWTLKGIITKFIDVASDKIDKINNGSIVFKMHFRNGKVEKVEVDAKEFFGSE